MTGRCVAAAVAAAAAVAVAGCAEASCETTEPEWHTTGPHAEMVENAETLLAALPATDDGWEAGVVLAEAGEGRDVVWAVAMPAGAMALLGPAWDCDGDEGETGLWVLIDPGDLIAWSTEGNDSVVCADEIRVETKAATQRLDR